MTTARRVGFCLLFALHAAPVAARQRPGPADAADSAVALASRAIDEGRPWQATRLLARYSAAAPDNPALALTAARAAAEWEGWTTVIRLLQGERWLDSATGGDGRALLARAYRERGQAAEALRHGRRAVAVAAAPATRGARLVVVARALDRLGQLDSAAAAYGAAAVDLPEIGEWLRLRAAGVTIDSAARAALYRDLTSPTARSRIGWTEALALDRAGDWRRSADRYAALGARMAAIRLRLANGDSAVRRTTRDDLARLLAAGLPADEIADAVRLFDRYYPNPTGAEHLSLARRAGSVNLFERAVRAYAAAGNRLTDRDRLTYAAALSRVGRVPEALAVYDAVTAPSLRADAAYQRARLLVRSGQPGGVQRALRAIPRNFPNDSVPAGTALFLLGDLLADRGVDDSARVLFLESFHRYPTTAFGRRAGFQAAIIAFVDRDFDVALTEFDRLAAVAAGEDAAGARYWAGRVLLARGDSAGATARWRELRNRTPESYYSWLAAKRLGVPYWRFGDADTAGNRTEPALDRVSRLVAMGLGVEARFELDALVQAAQSAPDRGLGIAAALRDHDWHTRALRVAQRASERGAPFDRSLVELLYPLPYRDVLTAEATDAGIDPMLVAGLIRQESAYDPNARSVADARGLMQVLPSVGTSLARRARLPEWDPVLLYQPDVNLDFGIEHLAEGVARLGWMERALAAYNAGADPVERWQAIRGVGEDPEVFVERIPFAETRDYVRKVLRNYAMYVALYRPAAQ
ncbi:MAG: transglycosylase SLT domain-containing protein [Gemmatimonadales bacterium]